MSYFTTNTYQLKREIVNFSKKICKNSNKPTSKFVTDMLYGISKSKDIILSSISEALDENISKINTIDRLSNNLSLDLDESIFLNYCNLAFDALGNEPVFLVDDSDVTKPLGNKFEALGIVRDGSSKDKSYEKGYHHTEIVGLTNNFKQPISLFSKIHSSIQKEYISNNNITYEGLNSVVTLLNERSLQGTFVLDRGYDSNDIFNYFFNKNQHFVIRLTEKRKIYYKHRWNKITTLRDGYKGKLKFNIMFQNVEKECLISVIKAQITASKKWINIFFVYGLSDTPMMLASNIPIKSKEDALKVARLYFSRWRIEEYFKFKKQEYNFENFRVRSLKSINNLNLLLTYTIGFIALMCEKLGKNMFAQEIIKESNSLRDKVYLWFYQMARGIYNILKNAKIGIKEWQNIQKSPPNYCQLSLF